MCQRKLFGNSPVEKKGGRCLRCAPDARIGCLCDEIYQPRIASKVRSVRRSALARLRKRREQCIHHRPEREAVVGGGIGGDVGDAVSDVAEDNKGERSVDDNVNDAYGCRFR